MGNEFLKGTLEKEDNFV